MEASRRLARLLVQLAADEGVLSLRESRLWVGRLGTVPTDLPPTDWLVQQGALTQEQVEYLQGRLRDRQLRIQDHETIQIVNLSRAPDRTCAPSIPGYEILDSLGGGGAGAVYRARQHGSDGLVALKVLRGGALATEAQRLRFEREALAVADLRHPGLVRVHDFGEAGGQLYFTMDLVEGDRLDRYLEAHNPPRRERLLLMQRVCEAMAHAHRHGVIHRDLKPSNILVDQSGQPKILDFGVAKLTETRNGVAPLFVTQEGEVLGTVSYMAPEQTLGRPQEIDTRTDVYALGVILYEVLTGRLPVDSADGDAIEVMRAIREEVPVRPGKVDPSIDEDLETVVLTALTKDKERRYQSAREMAEDISRYLSGEPIEAKRASAIYELRRLVRRYRTVLVPAVCAMALVTAAVLFAFVRVRAERNGALLAERRAEQAWELAEQEAYSARINLAGAKLHDREYSWVRRLLDNCPQRFRHWEWAYLHKMCHPELKLFSAEPEVLAAAAFGPDGSTVVGTTFLGTVKTWDLQTGQSTACSCQHVRCGPRADGVSPDGLRVVMAREDKTAGIWDVRTGAELAVLQGHSGTLWSGCFSPDGKRVATASADGTARIWDAETGRELLAFSGHEGEVRRAAFSPNGACVVTCGQDGAARIWDARTGRELQVLVPQNSRVTTAAFSPQGDRVATATQDGSLVLWRADTGEVLKGHQAHQLPVQWIAFAPNGRWLATASADGTARVWDVELESPLFVFAGHGGPVERVEFSPQGDRLLTTGSDSTARLWDLTEPQEGLAGEWNAYHVLAFSPDGSRALGANWQDSRGESGGHDCAILRADTAERLVALVGHGHPLHSGAFSPNGRRAATLDDGGIARTWDVETGTELATFEAFCGAPLHPMSWGPEGKRLISVGPDWKARVRDAETGEELLVIEHPDAVSAAFGPRGERVVTTHMDWSVRVWDARTAQEILTINCSGGLCRLASFSPDGRRIATGCDDRTARVWDAQSGAELAVLEGHENAVFSASFSPDGARVVTADRYGTCKVWNAETGHELLTLSGPSVRFPYCATFSPDGLTIRTAGDGQMMVFAAEPWAAAAR